MIEKPITKEQELIDYIYKKKTYIFEYYSIYDLLSLIRYAKNDKNKIIYLLDNYSKEENMDIIEKSKSINYISNIHSIFENKKNKKNRKIYFKIKNNGSNRRK